MKDKDMKDERMQSVVIVVLVFLLVILVIGVTYAAFHYVGIGKTENVITTGTMTMEYVEGEKGISITNAMPMSSEVGKKLSADNETFDFSVALSITGNQGIVYEITAVKQDISTMDDSDVRLYLEKGTEALKYTTAVLEPSPFTPITEDDGYGAKKGEMILTNDGSTTSITNFYRLRMWVDSSYQLSGTPKTYQVRVNAYGRNATDSELETLR